MAQLTYQVPKSQLKMFAKIRLQPGETLFQESPAMRPNGPSVRCQRLVTGSKDSNRTLPMIQSWNPQGQPFINGWPKIG